MPRTTIRLLRGSAGGAGLPAEHPVPPHQRARHEQKGRHEPEHDPQRLPLPVRKIAEVQVVEPAQENVAVTASWRASRRRAPGSGVWSATGTIRSTATAAAGRRVFQRRLQAIKLERRKMIHHHLKRRREDQIHSRNSPHEDQCEHPEPDHAVQIPVEPLPVGLEIDGQTAAQSARARPPDLSPVTLRITTRIDITPLTSAPYFRPADWCADRRAMPARRSQRARRAQIASGKGIDKPAVVLGFFSPSRSIQTSVASSLRFDSQM